MTGQKLKDFFEQHRGIFWAVLIGLLAVIFVFFNLYRPRDIRISGRIEGTQQGQPVDVRVLFFDTDDGANIIKTAEYDNVSTTADGRFDLVYRTNLASLPSNAFMQICIRNAEAESYGAIPVCTESSELAEPDRVLGADTNDRAIVSCTRKQVNGSVSGVFERAFGFAPDVYEFYEYCNDVYSETEHAARINSVRSIGSADRATLDGDGDTFITIDSVIERTADPQTLTISGNTLTISEGNSVALPVQTLTDSDQQQLTLDGMTLSIQNGNSVVIPEPDPAEPIGVSLGAGLTGSNNVALGGTLTLSNSGILGIATSGPVTSTGGQNPTLGLTLCANGEVLQVAGGAWSCNSTAGTYSFSISDGVTSQGITSGDQIRFLAGTGLASSVSATDTVTFSVPAGGIGSTEIANGSIANVDLANSNITITAGSGLSGGGNVSLGGSVSLDNSGILSIGTTGPVTSSGGQNPNIALAACAGGQILKYNSGLSAWECSADVDTDTDTQDLSLASNTLSLVNGGSVSLAGYLDNTDSQDLSLSSNTLSLTGDGTTVDLSGFLDDTDDQTLSIDGSDNLIIVDGNSVSLLPYLDNTDNQDLTLTTNTLALTGDGTTVDLSGYLDNTDAQAISVASNILSISGNAGTVDLSVYLDNTDTQDLSLVTNTLSLVDGGSVDLSGYLDNTDNQDLTLTTNTLALTGDGTTVDLSSYLDNTDQLTSLSCSLNEIAKWNGSAWACAADVDTDTQDLSLVTNTLSLVDGGSVDLSGYLDNTDTLAGLSCGSGQVAQWNGSTWICANAGVDTDDQTLSIDGSNNLIIADGNSVSLAAYLDNTDSQDLTLTTNTLALTGDGTTVDLSGYLDNTDAQAISVASNILSISGNPGTVDLSVYLDNTDTQDLSLVTNTLSLVDGGSVDLSGYLDNTDSQDLSLSSNTLSLTGDGTTVDLSAYLDDTTIADDQTLSIDGSDNLIIADGNSVSLLPYLDNTDAQDLTLTTNTLALTGDGTTVDLSGYLDNTDAQAISVASNILSISGNAGTVDLSVYLDNTDTQDLSLVANTLSLVDGGSVDLSGYLDNTDAQDLTLTTNTLALTGDGTTVDLSSYLDNTDQLTSLSCSPNEIAKWTGAAWACAVDVDTDTDTDTQDLSLVTNTLSLVDGGSVDLSGYLDNTDTLAGLSCGLNQVAQWNGSAWICASAAVDTDDQTLSIDGSNNLIIADGNSVSLATYLDNTDSQDLTLTTNTLALTGDGTTVDLSGYLDNTDAQAISVASNILSISGNPGTVDLSVYLDNTDTQDLSLVTNTLSLVDGGSVDLSGYLDNTDSQDLSLSSNTLSLTGDGTTVDLSAYLDDTTIADDQTLSIDGSNNLIIADGNSVSLLPYLDNTDAQDLTLTTNTLALTGDGTTVDLSGYLDNTDAQAISVASNILSISGNAGTVDLSVYLDNTDTQDLSLVTNTLSLVDGGSVDLSGYLDNTDAQDLTLTTNTLALTGDGTTVDLSSYLDNTDQLASLSCSLNEIAKWTGAAWACAVDVDTDTDTQDLSLVTNTLSLVDGGSVDLSGYLDNTDTLAGLSCGSGEVAQWNGSAWICVSAAVDTDDQTLSIDGSNNLIIADGNSVSLAAYLDNTDSQDLTLTTNTLALTGDGTTVDLSGYLDNTDAQAISVASNILSISGNAGTVDLSVYLDNTDTQDLSLVTNTLSLVDGGSVDLSGYLDNTDNQDLSLSSNTLSLTGDGTTVDLSAYLDDTTIADDQTLSIDGSDNLIIADGNSVSLLPYLDNTDAQDLTLTTNTLALTGDGTTVDLSGYLDNTDSQAISVASNILSISGDVGTVDLSVYLDNTDTQDLSLVTNTLSLVDGGSVDLSGYLDNTDAQDLTLTTNTLALTGDGTTVDLSSYLDNTDTLNALSCGSNEIAKWNGSAWACAVDVDTDTDTDTQDLSLVTNTLSLVDGGSVDLSGYLDNTDTLAGLSCGLNQIAQWNGSAWICASAAVDTDDQTLSIDGSNNLIIADGNSVSLATYLDNTDSQDLTLTTNTLALTGDGTTVDLSGYLDNTDAQAISVASNILSISGNAGTVDLSVYLDNTDTQDLSLVTNTLSLVDGGSVDLSGYLDNTDNQDLSLSSNTLSLTGDGTTVDLSAYLDDTTIADDQTLSIDGSDNLIIADGNSVSLLPYLDNTDAQDLTLTTNTLALTGDGTTVDLSGYLDNTDAQAISVASNILSISGNAGTVDLSVYLDNTDTQDLSLATNTLSLVDGGSVDLSGYLDNTDAQDLTLTTNTLALTGDGTTVDLSGYLDNTDSFFTIDTPSGTNPQADALADTLQFLNGTGVTIIGDGTLDTVTISAVLGTSIDTSEITNATILFEDLAANGCLNGQIIQFNGSVWVCDSDDTDDADAVIGNEVTDRTDANSGLVRSGTGTGGDPFTLGIRSDCSTDEYLSWDGTGWVCTPVDDDTIYATGKVNSDGTEADVIGASTTQNGTGDYTVTLDTALSSSDYTVLLSVEDTLPDDTNINIYDQNTGDFSVYTHVGDNGVGANVLANANWYFTVIADSGSLASLSLDNDTLGGLSCTDTQVAKWNNTGSVWECADDVDTTYSQGTGVSIVGTVISATLGTDVDSSEIANGTILFEDIAQNGCSGGETVTWNGSAWICGGGFTISDGSNTDTIDGDDTLTFTAGSGVTVLVGATDTVTISAVLGTSIDSSEIENGTITADDLASNSVDTDEIVASAITTAEIDDATITFADIAQNACTQGQFMGWDGSAWVCSNPVGPTAQVYSGQSTEVNTASYVAIPFDNQVLVESGVTHSTVTNNTRVELDSAGTYFVSYSVSYESQDGNRKNIECGVRLNGSTLVTPSLSYSYVRQTNDPFGTSESSTIITTTLDNEYYEIVCQGVGSTAGTASATLVPNESSTIVSSTSTGVANGAGGGSSAFDITDGSNTETVNTGETVTFAAGTGLSVLVGASDTVTYSSDLGADIASAEIVNATILFEDLASNGCLNGEIMEYNGSAWICGTDDGLTSEVDGIVGNEVLDVTVNGGLTRSGLGTAVSPYTLGLRTDCSANEFLSWDGSAWGCNTPVYEKIVIWAEDNGTASAADTGGDEYSFGNGSVGQIGVTLAEDWELYAVGYDAETFGTSVDVDVINRNGGGVLYSFTANADDFSETIAVPVSVSAGDVIGFRTTNTSGATTDIRAAVYLRRLP